jgi:hypothetical protein
MRTMTGWEPLLSPMILFFVLGALAAFAKSDLAIPESIAKGMSLYLMAAIGLKGGAQVAASGLSYQMASAVVGGVALSILLPVPVFLALRRLGKLDPLNAAAVAAHYGSVSVVTFATGIEVLKASGLEPAGYMVAVLALMETPAIIVGLLLARRAVGPSLSTGRGVLHEAALNGSVVLMIGAFVIGLVAGKEGMAPVAPVFETAFLGVLCFFLLDMGLVAARRLQDTGILTARLACLAILIPLCNGTIGVGVGYLIGLDVGSAAALGILAGSASYIAVPAAMRLALPQADPGISLGMSLAITFPFNITLGIPIYSFLATRIFTA